MRYLGSKESLTDSIKELLQEHNLLQRNYVFFDAFCGMGSVADSMKSIYVHIIINLLLPYFNSYSMMITMVYIW